MADCRLTTNLRFRLRRDIRRSVLDAAKLSVKPLHRREGARLAVGTSACSRRSATAPGLTALCCLGKQQAARSLQKRMKSLQHSSITSRGTLRYLSVSMSHRRCWVADPRRLRVHRAGAGAGATATSGHTSVPFDAAERSCRRLRSCSIEVAAPFPNQMRDTRFLTWL